MHRYVPTPALCYSPAMPGLASRSALHPSLFLILFTTVALCSQSQRAPAFCLAPHLQVSDEFYTSTRVLSGNVEQQRLIRDPEDPDSSVATVYTVRIDHVYRGARNLRRIKIYSENTTARFSLDLHRRYLLFLNHSQEGWYVDNCGNSDDYNKSAKVLKVLRQLPLTPSFIYGELIPYAPAPNVCPPMQLSVQSATFTGTTSLQPDCTFHLDTPPGTYSARLLWQEKAQPLYDLPYKNVFCFIVPEGGSAGIAFRPDHGTDQENTNMLRQGEQHFRDRCDKGLTGIDLP